MLQEIIIKSFQSGNDEIKNYKIFSVHQLIWWSHSFYVLDNVLIFSLISIFQTNLPVFKIKESSVRRRYSDFEWLRSELERDSKVNIYLFQVLLIYGCVTLSFTHTDCCPYSTWQSDQAPITLQEWRWNLWRRLYWGSPEISWRICKQVSANGSRQCPLVQYQVTLWIDF